MLFILASVVVVVNLAELQFDRFFYAGLTLGGVTLLVSKHKLLLIAGALIWMGLRLFIAGAFAAGWSALGLGALLLAVAYAVIIVIARREEYDGISHWRR